MSRDLKLFIHMVVGLSIAVPYIFVSGVKDSMVFFGSVGFTEIVVLVALFMGVRGLALLTSHPDDWRGEGTDHIARVRQFRESRLKGLSPEDGSKLLRSTQLLDMAGDEFGPDSATARTRRYINSRLAGMTPAQGLEYMQGKRP